MLLSLVGSDWGAHGCLPFTNCFSTSSCGDHLILQFWRKCYFQTNFQTKRVPWYSTSVKKVTPVQKDGGRLGFLRHLMTDYRVSLSCPGHQRPRQSLLGTLSSLT